MKAVCVLMVIFLVSACTAARRPAPVEDRRPAAAPAAKAPAAVEAGVPTPEASYTVKKGDTLYSIALEHGHDYRDLAMWNSLEDPTKLRVGQVLRMTPPTEQAAPAVVVGAGRAGGRVESRPLDPGQQKPAPQVQKPSEEPRLLESEPMRFAWPVKGKIVAAFAEPRQKGIDIAGRTGDAVSAAAPGRVTYVGSGIPGLGKLVVIKHDQGYITVYANNKDILVKEQQNVTRGQKIAELGEKLHFQIRKGAVAVDPLLYLPKS